MSEPAAKAKTGRPRKSRAYLTGMEMVVDVTRGQTHVHIKSIPQLIREKHGAEVSLNSVRHHVSKLAGQGALCYVSQGTVSDTQATGFARIDAPAPLADGVPEHHLPVNVGYIDCPEAGRGAELAEVLS